MEIWQEAKEGLSALRARVWPGSEERVVERPFHGPEAVASAAWFTFATVITLWNRARIEAWWMYVGVNVALIVSILLASRYTQRCRPEAACWIRLGHLVVLILSAFSETGYLLDRIDPVKSDATLIAIDLWIFGVHPTVWLSAWLNPVAVEILQWTYATYYFLPIALGTLLIRRGRFREFDTFCLAIVLGFYVSYVGYYMVPAVGPRLTIHVDEPLPTGLWGFHTIYHVLNSLEPTKMDCFPSGHTLVTSIVLWFAWKYSRRSLVILGPLGLGILASTMYLRYHYVIDVLAGLAICAVLSATAPRMVARWYGEDD